MAAEWSCVGHPRLYEPTELPEGSQARSRLLRNCHTGSIRASSSFTSTRIRSCAVAWQLSSRRWLGNRGWMNDCSISKRRVASSEAPQVVQLSMPRDVRSPPRECAVKTFVELGDPLRIGGSKQVAAKISQILLSVRRRGNGMSSRGADETTPRHSPGCTFRTAGHMHSSRHRSGR